MPPNPLIPRDNFSPNTRRILGERVAYICSNPDCRNNTIGPHSDPKKSLDTGIAAHICGAAQGGPRYDSAQTSLERSGIANGVWLCATCSKLVDTDEKLYPAGLLRQWRREHEQWVSGQEMIPKLPDLRIEAVQGLSLPLVPGTITAEDCERIRERQIVLKNPNRVSLFQFDLRIQFPEPIIGLPRRPEVPPGVDLQFNPRRSGWVASASGEGASVTVNRPPRPTTNWSLKLDCLPAQTQICIVIHTILDWSPFPPLPATEPGEPEVLEYFIMGDYFFDYRRERIRRRVLVPFAI